ncbi:lysM and putative peptidoglycan-binding domain-containing protein 1 [Xenopus laevis]|uniref:LysM and putative peptidoglycan-binding domain-containing protein 1 n=2 Tax=Xenopus laevis TaxID=8355 RepID=LYSM1_XENLA|nr:lysM and putative peptidoglycan-binding domain-containing protein 1 [Xenopus laevis]Q5PQ30.1 RecName: Full=LysM and putative peptidoglycan-binding domain-containing protein 1 [Xenopus laevis]AAH87389.1 LOC495999 protein [Xenopus laevis]OCT66560.1 hypothetical protein XELAEV_18042811mg [Xenopus laevis]
MASNSGHRDTRLLHGARTRSYGSLVQTTYSPAQIRKLEHQVQPGDTLQGLALRYGVSMEQIKRANRLYTNDSIFLKKSLYIPATAGQSDLSDDQNSQEGSETEGSPVKQPEKGEKQKSRHHVVQKDEMSPVDFMSRLDTNIRVSKRAAVKKLREGESFATEESTPGGAPGYQGNRTPSRQNSPQTQQRSLLGPVPLTITTRASTIRDHEDEIFKL